jgi:hypothetical protein
MSYCRFANTLRDLQDCHGHMEKEVSSEESSVRERLIELCAEIANDYAEEATTK